jgi:hypothetical protein
MAVHIPNEILQNHPMRKGNFLYPRFLYAILLQFILACLPSFSRSSIPTNLRLRTNEASLMFPEALSFPVARISVVRMNTVPVPVREGFVISGLVRYRCSTAPG